MWSIEKNKLYNVGKPHVKFDIAIITIYKYSYTILIITFINRLKINFVRKVVGEAVKSITKSLLDKILPLPKPHTLLITTIQTCCIMVGICATSSDLNG